MYTKLKKIYSNTRYDVFVMAVAYLVDVGYRTVISLQDEEIDELEGNGLMTADFVRDLVRKAREIAQALDTPTEIIQFCQAEEIFDVKYYVGECEYD